MKITIHQPEFMPCLGLLDKISKADLFVMFDSAQFQKNYFDNRQKIRTNNDWQYVTVPVEKENHKPFTEVKIINQEQWQKKILNAIKQNYSRAKYFEYYYPVLEQLIANQTYNYVSELNIKLIETFLSWFNVKTPIIESSALNLQNLNQASVTLLEICKKTNATAYLSGISGKDYLDRQLFIDNNINVTFQDFYHPVYKQVYSPFIPYMSALDLLMNYGEESKDIIKAKGIGSIKMSLEKIDYKDKSILEMFGGKGEGQLSVYGNDCKEIVIWELDKDNCNSLKENYKDANVLNVDSLEEMKNSKWIKKFDILMIDTHVFIHTNQVLPQALNMLKDEGIVIFRAIKKLYKENSDIKVDLSLKEWATIFNNSGYEIFDAFEQEREYYFSTFWLSNYIFKLRREQ